jgi:hypothetical protein
MTFAMAITAGCTGFKPRPEPFDCPDRVRRVMTEQLGWRYRDRVEAIVDDRYEWLEKVTFRPGQEVVTLAKPHSMDAEENTKFPKGTQFFGTVYVDPESGKERDAPALIIVKYDRVKLPGHSQTLPVCVIGEVVDVKTLEKDGSVQALNRVALGVRPFYPQEDFWYDPMGK